MSLKLPLNAHSIHFVGIGGIGMSALAQLLHHEGKDVRGSDREQSPTITLLVRRGIPVTIEHDGSTILPGTELVIYSDAIWPEHPARQDAIKKGIPQMSYFEALGRVSKDMRAIAVAGTHGKTTTTAMLAGILKDQSINPSAIIGSLVQDFHNSNFLAGREDLLVVEACEYRNHLLELAPRILVITNIELDHTDFFTSLEDMQQTFRTAAEKVPKDGAIITNPNDANIAAILKHVSAPIADYTKETVPKLSLIGEFNVWNAKAAKTAARVAFPEINPEQADTTLALFKGAWRRFEYKGETKKGATVYDDYAHHPTAIEKTIAGIREKFPDMKLIIAFHPHLYSRTKSFLVEFGEALAKADESIIAPIYGAREPLDPEISNKILADKISAIGGKSRAIDSFEDIRKALSEYGFDTLVLTMGAGDIYKVAEQIVEE